MEHASIKNQNFSVCLQDTLLIKKEMPNHKSPAILDSLGVGSVIST